MTKSFVGEYAQYGITYALYKLYYLVCIDVCLGFQPAEADFSCFCPEMKSASAG